MIIPTLLPVRQSRQLLRRGTDDWLGDFLSAFDGSPWKELESSISGFSPRMNLKEDESNIVLTAELPGMTQEDVHLSLKGGYLTIKGHKQAEKEDTDCKNCRYTERAYGEFERVIPIQAEIDSDRVDASMKNGVLTLTLPKIIAEREKEKKISIRKV